MKPTPEIAKVAMNVLTEARALDPRSMQFDTTTVGAWARCLAGQPVWPDEALEAVHDHYRQEVAYPLKPGDVIAYCKTQPVWSSPEHASYFLDQWAQHPYATVIEEYSGIQLPEFEVPADIPHQDVRGWLVERLTAWIDDNRDRLVAAIVARRYEDGAR